MASHVVSSKELIVAGRQRHHKPHPLCLLDAFNPPSPSLRGAASPRSAVCKKVLLKNVRVVPPFPSRFMSWYQIFFPSGQVLVDIIVRELANLPAGDVLRADYNGFLARLLDQSEWATRGGRYREHDIKQATGGQI